MSNNSAAPTSPPTRAHHLRSRAHKTPWLRRASCKLRFVLPAFHHHAHGCLAPRTYPMFDPEQYANTQYYSRYMAAGSHIDPTSQTAFLPYFHQSYRQGLGSTCNVTNIPNGKSDAYICKWVDPDTHRICNRPFAYMQDIGKLNRRIQS